VVVTVSRSQYPQTRLLSKFSDYDVCAGRAGPFNSLTPFAWLFIIFKRKLVISQTSSSPSALI
jgi:hypothetical protein